MISESCHIMHYLSHSSQFFFQSHLVCTFIILYLESKRFSNQSFFSFLIFIGVQVICQGLLHRGRMEMLSGKHLSLPKPLTPWPKPSLCALQLKLKHLCPAGSSVSGLKEVVRFLPFPFVVPSTLTALSGHRASPCLSSFAWLFSSGDAPLHLSTLPGDFTGCSLVHFLGCQHTLYFISVCVSRCSLRSGTLSHGSLGQPFTHNPRPAHTPEPPQLSRCESELRNPQF